VTAAAAQVRPRDPRLDFFRGLGMFIIFIAHLPWNSWALYIPARFGFSDATEIFVFCSGMASAIAFGRIFDERGWRLGTARILHRMWQVYWAHVCLFLVIAGGLAAFQATGFAERCCNLPTNYVAELNLHPFFDRTAAALPGLLTLTYVPNYFDILPMYIVVLALIPVVMGLSLAGRPAVLVLIAGLWLAANLTGINLPAEPWSSRGWFFNPFAWQLVFFTGFAFMRGWVPAPPVSRVLIIAAAAILLASLPFAYFRIYESFPAVRSIRDAMAPLWDKTNFGILRYVHFLALAYIAWIAAGSKGRYLVADNLWGSVVAIIRKVGQQSLAVFLASLVVAQTIGILRDMAWGRGNLVIEAAANIAGFAVLIAVAYSVAWFKTAPWRSTGPAVGVADGRGKQQVRVPSNRQAAE